MGQAGGGGRGQAGGDGRRAGGEVGGMGQAVRSLAEGGQAAGWWSAERCWELVGRSGGGPSPNEPPTTPSTTTTSTNCVHLLPLIAPATCSAVLPLKFRSCAKMRGASPENFSEFPLKSLLICCGVSKTSPQIFADSPELSAGGLQVSLEKCSREGRFTSLEIPLSFPRPPQGKVNAVSIVWYVVSNARVIKQSRSVVFCWCHCAAGVPRVQVRRSAATSGLWAQLLLGCMGVVGRAS